MSILQIFKKNSPILVKMEDATLLCAYCQKMTAIPTYSHVVCRSCGKSYEDMQVITTWKQKKAEIFSILEKIENEIQKIRSLIGNEEDFCRKCKQVRD